MTSNITTSTCTNYTSWVPVSGGTTSNTIGYVPLTVANETAENKAEEKKMKTKLGTRTMYKDVRTGEIFRYEVSEGKKELFIKTNIIVGAEGCADAVNIETGADRVIRDEEPVEVVKAVVETCE